jgi:hypothetical protein
MPDAAARPRLVFHMSSWDGPSKATLIQGLLRDPVTKEYFITQADNVAGQASQNVVIRRHLPNLGYADSQTVRRGGHGSSVGVENDGGTRIWIGHDQHGVGRFPYKTGQTGFERVPCLPDGDVSVHRDVICVRSGNRFRGYRLADAKAGRTTQLFDFTIPRWGAVPGTLGRRAEPRQRSGLRTPRCGHQGGVSSHGLHLRRREDGGDRHDQDGR